MILYLLFTSYLSAFLNPNSSMSLFAWKWSSEIFITLECLLVICNLGQEMPSRWSRKSSVCTSSLLYWFDNVVTEPIAEIYSLFYLVLKFEHLSSTEWTSLIWWLTRLFWIASISAWVILFMLYSFNGHNA